MPVIDVRDTRLYYEIEGEGEPALLFIHGMCGGAWTWEDQVGRLSDRFTCVSYDRRGHSRSEAGSRDQSDCTHADDAVALIETLGLDRPVIVASSGGAVVAVELLHRYPETVRGAVLSEPPLFSVDPQAGQTLVNEIGPPIQDAVERGGPRAAVDAFFAVVCPGLWSQIGDERKDRFRDNAGMLFAALERDATTVTLDDLARIDVPVLLVSGSASNPIFGSITKRMIEHLPDVRHIELEGSGHVTYAEQPVEFARAVTAFASELSAVRATTAD